MLLSTCPTTFDWTQRENTPSKPRRVVIATQRSSESIEAQLIWHIFQEANQVPDVSHAYAVEQVSFEETKEASRLAREHLSEAIDQSETTDTIFIMGPYAPDSCNVQSNCLDWLRFQCARSRRIAAIAGGTLYLAAMDLLNGKAAVSHWSMHSHFANAYSKVSVRSDILYTKDGNIYTCAGGLASVDLALRMIEEDLGDTVSSYIARRLLVPFRRTAICSQISSTLQAQINVKHPIIDLLAWLPDQLTANLSIAKLARRVAMSPRNFARRFREQVKMTPGRYIEDLRFEAAKRELVRESGSINEVAIRCGFNNVESLRRLFQRRLGMTPSAFRDSAVATGSPTYNAPKADQFESVKQSETLSRHAQQRLAPCEAGRRGRTRGPDVSWQAVCTAPQA